MAKDDWSDLAAQARDAHAHEQELFAVKLPSSVWRGLPSGALQEWSQALTVVEANGWTLDQWTVAVDNNGAAQAFPVFRRRRPANAVAHFASAGRNDEAGATGASSDPTLFEPPVQD